MAHKSRNFLLHQNDDEYFEVVYFLTNSCLHHKLLLNQTKFSCILVSSISTAHDSMSYLNEHIHFYYKILGQIITSILLLELGF